MFVKDESETIKILFTAPTHAAKKNGRNVIGYPKEIDYSVIQSLTYEYFNKKEGEHTSKLLNLLKENNIEYIFIDESSMLDMPVYHKFLTIIEEYNIENYNNIHIVFIGDENQLSPIGIGPYHSLLRKIPTFKLTVNHRSNKEIKDFSNIILNNGPKGKNWSMDDIKDKYESIQCHFVEKGWKKELMNIFKEIKKDGYTPYEGDIGEEENNKVFQIISFKNDCCKRCMSFSKGDI